MKSWTNWLANTTNKGVHEFFSYIFLNIFITFLYIFLYFWTWILLKVVESKSLVSAIIKHILNERLVPF